MPFGARSGRSSSTSTRCRTGASSASGRRQHLAPVADRPRCARRGGMGSRGYRLAKACTEEKNTYIRFSTFLAWLVGLSEWVLIYLYYLHNSVYALGPFGWGSVKRAPEPQRATETGPGDGSNSWEICAPTSPCAPTSSRDSRWAHHITGKRHLKSSQHSSKWDRTAKPCLVYLAFSCRLMSHEIHL